MLKYLFFTYLLCINISCGSSESTIKKTPFNPKVFPLGIFSADPQDDVTFERLRSAGFNWVHTYGATDNFLKLANKHDMKVMYDLAAHKHKDSEWLSKTMETVNRVKDDPSIGMWYLWDEPNTETLPFVDELREEVGKVSGLPTSLVIHWRENWTDTRGHSDIWMVDQYPVRGEDFPSAPLHNYTSFVSSAAKSNIPGTPFIPVMQAMDFSCFSDQARNLEDKSKLRYPNLTELRFMAFSSLTYGVEGLFFWSYWHCHSEKASGKTFFDEVLTSVVKEIKAFDETVGELWNVKKGIELNRNNNINIGYWERSSGNFIVMTNNSPEVRNLEVDLSKVNGFPNSTRKMIPWGTTSETDVILNRGVLSIENVGPWETFIWLVK